MNYQKCMVKLIIKGNIPKSIPRCIINTFEEEYNIYLRTANKYWRTKEGFSLEFDSTLSDLQKSHFVYVDSDDIIKVLKQKLNVIEEV